ncbi:hypothetical protein IE81DRAFT_204777 [Ceraceosorus guamensis]|uniref:Uncharacterized protein n=1 Tax=Ceraceosorus guamensis TaxID=1522189 RepID=A0A316VT40_9BASI|nr:hypothetical protein IE81DRAFT_204777 [Ceraceosorus guamensis]PWN40756.1 hypothetical protein IE81DRAFT_204777 [Ceraceosorus guamensis]
MSSNSSSSNATLRRWVSDHSMSLFGLSDSSMIDYLLLTATQSSSLSALSSSLSSLGLPDNLEGQAFVKGLWQRADRPASAVASIQTPSASASTAALPMQRERQRYGLLLDDADEMESLSIKPEKRKKKKARLAAATADQGEEDVERGRKRGREEAAGSEEESEDVRLEKARLQDAQERDEFSRRMRERDSGSSSSKRLIEDRSSKSNPEIEARRLLAEDAGARRLAMPDLRQRSRQEYLAKRSVQQLELLRMEVADEERYLRGIKATKRERRELEYKKEVLRIAEERAGIDEDEDKYVMPEDYITEKGRLDSKKKEQALYQRYEDSRNERLAQKNHITDVDLFEREQIEKSRIAPLRAGDGGIAGTTLAQAEEEEAYEYVFDDSQRIEFLMDSPEKLADAFASLSSKDAALQAQIKEAEARVSSIEQRNASENL